MKHEMKTHGRWLGYFATLFLLTVAGCSSAELDNNIVIDIKNYTVKGWDELPERLLQREKIVLKTGDDSSNTMFGQISDIKIENDRIYVMDTWMRKLVAFDWDGNAVMSVGMRGRGPGEYMNVDGFDIDKEGNIYIIDGNLDKVLVYNKNGKFIKEVKPLCEIDILKVLDNGNYLFQVSSWEAKVFAAGQQLMVTDSAFNKISELLRYSSFKDDNFLLSDNKIIKTENGFFYHKPIDDYVYFLNNDGQIKQTYFFDFGSDKVPDESKKDVEGRCENGEFKNYSTLINFTVIGEDFIYGSMKDKGKTVDFIADRQNKIIYKNNCEENTEYGKFCGCSDNKMISYKLIEGENLQQADFELSVLKI